MCVPINVNIYVCMQVRTYYGWEKLYKVKGLATFEEQVTHQILHKYSKYIFACEKQINSLCT